MNSTYLKYNFMRDELDQDRAHLTALIEIYCLYIKSFRARIDEIDRIKQIGKEEKENGRQQESVRK